MLEIDPEFRKLIAPLRPDELAELEKSILRDGCLEPLTVWKHDGESVLLDGHTRHKICTQHNIKFEIKHVQLESKEDARLWIEEHQIARRNLTNDQRAEIWVSILKRRAKQSIKDGTAKAREAKSLQANSAGAKRAPTEPKPEPKERVREQVARESGLSEKTLRTMKKVADKSPKLALAVRNGEMTLREANAKISGRDTETKNIHVELSREDKIFQYVVSAYHPDLNSKPDECIKEMLSLFGRWRVFFSIPDRKGA